MDRDGSDKGLHELKCAGVVGLARVESYRDFRVLGCWDLVLHAFCGGS